MSPDLRFLTGDERLALIDELLAARRADQQTIASLLQRVAELERQLKRPRGMVGLPGNKPQESCAPATADDRPPRRQRPQGFGRQRLTPTQVEAHAFAACPDCGTALKGGWVQRTREVVDLPVTPVVVTEHRYLARICPTCRRRKTPPVALDGVVVGQHRFGVRLMSLMATLRGAHRLPVRHIPALLQTLYGVRVSTGGVTAVFQRFATEAQPAVAAILAEVRQSPVVHGDETGWRQSGRNGYLWSFSTPNSTYLVRGSRAKGMVDLVLGPDFEGTLVSDFYAAYDHYAGPHQRCWVHLLRELRDLARLYPEDQERQRWSAAVRALYDAARADPATASAAERQRRYRAYTAAIVRLAQEHAADATSVVRRVSKRILRYQAELFTFVRAPTVPADNNAAERSLRPSVTSRKISGGTRSPAGTTVATTLATLFGTWRLRDREPLAACRQILSPHF